MPKKTEEIKIEKSKPAKSFRAGTVQASVFMNVVEKDGKKIKIPSVSFQNRYRDDKGEWQTTNKLNVSDIPKAVLVLNEAYKYLTLKQHQEDFFI